MARHERKTEPQDTLYGLLVDYSVVEQYLLDGEVKGRLYLHEWAVRRQNTSDQSPLSEYDLLDLHRHMYGEMYDWAGQPRLKDVGPGGVVHVPFSQVRVELRTMFLDLQARIAALSDPQDPDVDELGKLLAWSHHQFQWIHPFNDTNGRTGRIFDLMLL